MIKIDIDTRCWQIPKEEAFLGVESDDKVKILQFELSKNQFCDGLNFTDCNCFINYKNEGNDTIPYGITDMKLQEDGTVTFTWEVSRGATIFKGNTFAILCAKNVRDDGTVTNEWNSRIGSFTVSKGLEPLSSIAEVPEIDIISQLLSVAQKTNANAQTNIDKSSSLLEKAEGLRGQVSELKGDLVDLENDIIGFDNLLDNVNYINGKYINDNGELISLDDVKCTEQIPVHQTEYVANIEMLQSATVATYFRVHGYDANGWKRMITKEPIEVGSGTSDIIFRVPNDISTIRISCGESITINYIIDSNTCRPALKLNEMPNVIDYWEKGWLNVSTELGTSGDWEIYEQDNRMSSRIPVDKNCKQIIAKDGYLFRVMAFDSNDKSFGTYKDRDEFILEGNSKNLKTFDFTKHNYDHYRLTVLREDDGEITSDEAENCLIYLPFSMKEDNEKQYGVKYRYLPFMNEINNNNKNSLCLCALKTPIVNNKIPMHSGFLFHKLPNDDGEMFYGTTLENAKSIGKFNTDTSYISAHDKVQAISPSSGYVISATRGDRFNLYVWDGTVCHRLFANASLKPMGWLYNSGVDFIVDSNGVEHCIFAEYDGSATDKGGFYVWKGTYPYTSESDWKTVHHMDFDYHSNPLKKDSIVHFHQIRRDPWTNILYLTSGDKIGQLNWWYSSDFGETWNYIIRDSSSDYPWEEHILRCINFIFTKDYIYWAVDHGTNSCLNRIKRGSNGVIDISTRKKLCDIPFAIATNSCCYVESPNGIFMFTRIDIGEEYEDYYGSKVPLLLYSFEDNKLHTLGEIGLTNGSWGGHRGKCYLNYTNGQQPYPVMGFSQDTKCYFDIIGSDNENIGTIFYDIS